MLENLNVTTDLFACAEFSSAAVDVIRNQFVSTTRFLVDNDLSSSKNGNLANCFHESIFNILGPNLFRFLATGI